MPRVEFSETNVKKNDYDYPKFKLDKKGEVARIAILESPVTEFVHNIRKPKLVNGVAQKEVKTRRDGSTYEDYVYEFVSRPICLGDYGTLTEDGYDPDSCPICAQAKRSDRFSAPQRRFALHVVQYDIKPGSADVKEPFSASTKVYSFTDKVFNELVSFAQQGYDLRKHDIIVRAENPTFHGYGFMPAKEAAWLADDDRKKYIKVLMEKENLAPDLSIFCGSKKSEKNIEYDIREVNEAWDVATGVRVTSPQDAAASTIGSNGGLVGNLDDLFESNEKNDAWAPATTQPAADEVTPATSFADLGISEETSSDSGSDDDLSSLFEGLS